VSAAQSHSDDLHWMERALELAERGRGAVEPNPLVGAVIVRDGTIVGEGWHQKFGEAHAEVHALAAAGDRARGATLYVTLEPCCHTGKTPPCTDAVLRAGISRVVAALEDPFPKVGGEGVRSLRAAGIQVDVGAGAEAARRLNAPYLKLLATGLPYVHAKWAMTLDGKIATRTGDSRWISGPESLKKVHELRGRMDAIIVGIGTVLADDPLLTARPPGPRTPQRIVLDSSARLPVGAQLVRTAGEAPVLVVMSDAVTPERKRWLEAQGCRLLELPAQEDGRPAITDLLRHLGGSMTNVLVEGGAQVLGSFLDAHMIDEVHAFVAPVLAGGRDAITPIAGEGIERIAAAYRLDECQGATLGRDIYVHAWRR
jgi:diaminohydroxyphosphoribosylaminopyrimidine deaminase / 5-amino-6-(5-phosphoribosylamino)uracil reductase